MAASADYRNTSLTVERQTEALDSAAVTPTYFGLLGVTPELGRSFQPGDDKIGQNHVTMLSHQLWERRFGSDPKIVGSLVRLDGMDMPRNLSLAPANNASFLGVRASSTLARRYLQNTKWVKNSTSAEEIKKFEALSALFKKYAGQYDFYYLLIMAQAYQESMLDQRKHGGGTVGLMQVNPKLAAADPINIRNINSRE